MNNRRSGAGRQRVVAKGLPLLGLALCLESLFPGHAHAQEAVASDGQTPDQPGDVVVTAQRRSELQRDVPVAVSVIGPDTLATLSSSGQDIRALAARVPSLYAESTFSRSFPRFYIRGLGNSDYNYNAAAPVSVILDDVVMENPAIRGFPIFDSQSVEVLKGPQGTLFGRNTPAGVVKFNSVKPSDRYEAVGTVGYGTYDTVNLTGAINIPLIGDKLDLRVSGLYQHRDDYVTNTYPGALSKHLEGYDDRALRVQLRFRPTDAVDAILNVHGRSIDGSAAVVRAATIAPGSNRLVPGFDLNHVSFNGGNELSQDGRGANLHIDVTTGGLTFTSISSYEWARAYSRADIDGGAAPDVAYDVDAATRVPRTTETSQELRVATNSSGPFTAQAGLYYFHQTLVAINQYFDDTDYSVAEENSFAQQSTNLGVFGQATYKLTDKLKLTGGLRYSHERRSAQAFEGQPNPIDASRTSNASNVSGDVSATYALAPRINLYARYATGYQAPSFARNFTDADITLAKAQTTRSFEAGVKGSILDRRLTFSLDAYEWRTRNLQITASTGGTDTIQLTNARLAVGRGVEGEFDLAATDRLHLAGSASYNYTRISDPSLEVTACGSNCTLLNPVDPITGLVKVDGNPLYNAPRWILNGSARYSLPVGNGRVTLSTDWSYRGKILVNVYSAKEYDLPAMLLGGARLAYAPHAGRYEVAVFVRNIANQIRANYAYDLNTFAAIVSEPRIIGAEFSFHL